jgi:hypothetical protein
MDVEGWAQAVAAGAGSRGRGATAGRRPQIISALKRIAPAHGPSHQPGLCARRSCDLRYFAQVNRSERPAARANRSGGRRHSPAAVARALVPARCVRPGPDVRATLSELVGSIKPPDGLRREISVGLGHPGRRAPRRRAPSRTNPRRRQAHAHAEPGGRRTNRPDRPDARHPAHREQGRSEAGLPPTPATDQPPHEPPVGQRRALSTRRWTTGLEPRARSCYNPDACRGTLWRPSDGSGSRLLSATLARRRARRST